MERDPITWRLSDGTAISRRAAIAGESPVAARMRWQLAARDHGYSLRVTVDAQPCPSVELDTTNLVHVDVWVRDTARLHGLDVIEAPAIEATPPLGPAPADVIF